MSIDVEMLTVGPIAENCFLLRPRGIATGCWSSTPARRPSGSWRRSRRAGRTVEAILVTHCHFDHIGAVAPVARGDRRAGLLPRDRGPDARRHHGLRPLPGFGPFESYDADEIVGGGETLELAGLSSTSIFTPGHSPGHVTYSVRGEDAIFSGDVLFQGSVGRVDLPGGDGPTLLRSIGTLLDSHSPTRPSSIPATWA